MQLRLDSDVKAVAEFMQTTLPASRLVPVAVAIAQIGPLLWGRYTPEAVALLELSDSDQRK